MKKYKYSWQLLCAAFVMLAISCKKTDQGPSIDDYFLNYPIPEIPVTQDYVIGAFYYQWGTFNANIKQIPVVGPYTAPSGKEPDTIMAKHIDQAVYGGVDYFLFAIRSWNKDNGGFKSDSTLIDVFTRQNTEGKMKFALSYNFNAGSYGITTTNPLENDAVKLGQFLNDMERLAPFFSNPNYQKVNGKTLLYITNSHQMYSNDNPSIYKSIRERLSALGFDLYIVGNQERWSPAARYPFRFKNCVDAIYQQSYSSGLSDWDKWYLLPQEMDQAWKYNRKYFADSMNIDYIPNITPAYSWKISNPSSVNPEYPRTDSGKIYRTLCNVAKMNASAQTRLILVDSYNKFDEDTQLEPAESYGNLYLDITKQEFKKPQ